MAKLSGIRNAVEKYYSRGAYRTLDNVLITLHNKVPVSLIDAMMFGGIAVDIVQGVMGTNMDVSQAFSAMNAYAMSHAVAYMANRARRPLEETLGLDKTQLEFTWNMGASLDIKRSSKGFIEWLYEDPKYVGEQLRKLETARILIEDYNFPEHEGLLQVPDFEVVSNAVRDQLWKLEGKDPGRFPKVKKFSVMNSLLGMVGAYGSYAVISPEIYLSRKCLADVSNICSASLHALAHELVHSKGYTREKETEFIAHLACMNSTEFMLKRSTLTHRLFRNFRINIKSGKSIEDRVFDANLPSPWDGVAWALFAGAYNDKPKILRPTVLLSKLLSTSRDVFAYGIAGNKPSDYSVGFLSLLYEYEKKHGKV